MSYIENNIVPDRQLVPQEQELSKCKVCDWEYNDEDLFNGLCEDCLRDKILELYTHELGNEFIKSNNSRYREFLSNYAIDFYDTDEDMAGLVKNGMTDDEYIVILENYCKEDNDYEYIGWMKENHEELLDEEVE